MSPFTLPVEVHLHINDWRAVAVLAAVALALSGLEVARVGAALLCVVFIGLVALAVAEWRPVPPCTTHVLPPGVT